MESGLGNEMLLSLLSGAGDGLERMREVLVFEMLNAIL